MVMMAERDKPSFPYWEVICEERAMYKTKLYPLIFPLITV